MCIFTADIFAIDRHIVAKININYTTNTNIIQYTTANIINI